ncbi:MAG: hypothetical protein IAF08_01125 [Rhizobacter sp.]|nr:hypothetical protein [Chlorobiales bacterium]
MNFFKAFVATTILITFFAVPYAKASETNNPSLLQFLTGHLSSSMHAVLAPFLVLFIGAVAVAMIGNLAIWFGVASLSGPTGVAEKVALGAGLWWLFMMIPIPLGMAHVVPATGYWLIAAEQLLFSALIYLAGEGFAVKQLVLQK